ncbi:hypothetical protein [Streptomyces sp. NPDC049879]|uniref:hypothetical protein n=1 Tax=Streptomyces sp. NPDC049879 TaxID=3365598 RepID=UPI00378B1A9E
MGWTTLHHAVHHQNRLYSATAPAALCVAAILADPRTAAPVDKRPHAFPGPLRTELLGWVGSVAHEADGEAELMSRQQGFAPLRTTFRLSAVSACVDDQDPHVRAAAVAACIPLLDDPRPRHHRAGLVPPVREVLDALTAWGEDSSGPEGRPEAFAVRDGRSAAAPWSAESACPELGDTSDPPF